MRSSQMRYFDSRDGELGVRHIMASGALPPAFPAVRIDGELYWDGRLVQTDRTRAVMWYILARQSALPEENPEIFDRALQLEANVGEDELIEAEARAKVWNGQYPVEGMSRNATAN